MLAVSGSVLLLSGCGQSRSRRFPRVSLDVLAKVITPHETFVTNWAGKTLLPGVRSEVPCQLIGTSKLLHTASPGTGERSLSGVTADVCLQM